MKELPSAVPAARPVLYTWEGRLTPVGFGLILLLGVLSFSWVRHTIEGSVVFAAAVFAWLLLSWRSLRSGLRIGDGCVTQRRLWRSRCRPLEDVRAFEAASDIAPMGYQFGLSAPQGLRVRFRDGAVWNVPSVFGSRSRVQAVVRAASLALRDQRT